MAPVPASGSPNDAFARVSAALLAVWPQVHDQTSGPSRAERGLVLDQCGSDYRPLVDLLLDIGREVRPVLAPSSGTVLAAEAWANTRAPLVHKLVATRYLQPDVARWAVDVWGRVLRVAPPPAPPLVVTDSGPPPASAASVTTGDGGATRRQPVKPRVTVVTPSQVPLALRTVPSWAGGPVSPRVGVPASALAASGRLVVRGPTPTGPRYLPAERRAAVLFVLLLVIITVSMSQALRNRPTESGTLGTAAAAPWPADSMEAIGLDTMEPTPLVTAEATPAPVLIATPGSPDTSAILVAHDTLPLADLRADRSTMTGSVVDVGVGGRYRVSQRVRDVSGTESCDAVAKALAAGRETVEVVTHQPGAATFLLATRQVEGTLSSDGWFTAYPRSGTTNNVNWQFRMRGRFGPDGFSAVSETYTEAILRWGRTQHCVVTAELTGRRLPG